MTLKRILGAVFIRTEGQLWAEKERRILANLEFVNSILKIVEKEGCDA